VQGDNFVAEDVEAWLDVLGDGDQPRIVLGDKLIGSPLAGSLGAVNQTGLGNLEELELGLVDRLAAGAAAASEVVDDRAVVRLGPGVPLDVDRVTGLDDRVTLGVRGRFVADDIGVRVVLGAHEAVVSVSGRPAGDNGRILHVGKDGRVVGLIRQTVDDEILDVAVGSDAGGAGEGRDESLRNE